ncbi:MAG: ATP-binding protein [Allgaiera sp.]|jgi:signal transduction histidine kinase|nr:ATP-binding protein [Allgaiera sp.]
MKPDIAPTFVLLIDDDAGDRKLVRRLIGSCSAEARVTEAASVDEALVADQDQPDAIFLDHLLPGRTGLDCIEDLRARWPWSAIFIMTGQGDEVLAKSAIQAGATDYIPKNALSHNAVGRMLQNGVRAARERWKLEEQRRDLTLFSEVLVHDFKAPIRAASFLSDQIFEDFEAGDAQEAREGLRLLGKAARQMMDTVTSLEQHIRLDREVEHIPVGVAEILDSALTAIDDEIRRSGAQIEIHAHPALREVTCNAPQIAQVVQNLVANAIKYRGTAIPEIRIDVTDQDGTSVLFELRDNGIGIAEEFRERVFEPFKRLPGRSEVQGTGLGLATCKKFVVRHGGRIWCDAAEDGGSVFRFTLP